VCATTTRDAATSAIVASPHDGPPPPSGKAYFGSISDGRTVSAARARGIDVASS
jgi:hypothetical protein